MSIFFGYIILLYHSSLWTGRLAFLQSLMNKLEKHLIDFSDILINHVVGLAHNGIHSFCFLGDFSKLIQRDSIFELVELGAVLVQNGVKQIILGVLFDFALEGEDSRNPVEDTNALADLIWPLRKSTNRHNSHIFWILTILLGIEIGKHGWGLCDGIARNKNFIFVNIVGDVLVWQEVLRVYS